MSKTIAVINQKGGTGKTTTTLNLASGLAMYEDKNVLTIDADPQASLTVACGYHDTDALDHTLADYMKDQIEDEDVKELQLQCFDFTDRSGHEKKVGLIPSNISLSGIELSLFNAMNREYVLKNILDQFKDRIFWEEQTDPFEYILIDCSPSLGMLTINALAAADSVIIPVKAEYLSVKGLEQLLKTIAKVKRQINPKLEIDGILITMANMRTKDAQDMVSLIRDTYGEHICIFDAIIPNSVKVSESLKESESVFEKTASRTKASEEYEKLVKEVCKNG